MTNKKSSKSALYRKKIADRNRKRDALKAKPTPAIQKQACLNRSKKEPPESKSKIKPKPARKKGELFLLRALEPVRDDIAEHYLGLMDNVCRHCNAVFFRGESQSCCKNGQLCKLLMPKLLAFEDIPEVFKELYDERSPLSREFFEKIRILNSIFSFTTLGISAGLTRNEAIQINNTLGGYSIVIHGQIFHQISPLLPRPGTERTGSQVIFYDSQWEELERRGELCKDKQTPVSKELLKLIQDTLHLYNKLYKVYKPVGLQVIKETNLVSMVIVDDFRKIKIQKQKQKLYNRPTVDEVAGLITDKGNLAEYQRDVRVEYKRDICIEKQGTKLKRIDACHPATDPLGYALLFTKGDLGWSQEMVYRAATTSQKGRAQTTEEQVEDQQLDEPLPEQSVEQTVEQPDEPLPEQSVEQPVEQSAEQSTETEQEQQLDSDSEFIESNFPELKRITLKTKLKALTLYMFMNFFLHVRKESFNLLFKAKRLFHQYLVNKWLDIETIRLDFLRKNQKRLRRELYKGLLEACAKAQKAEDVGKAFVLPATHQGSPRQMFELYQDAMSIVCKYGKPDLFLTFTCNPRWQEIVENLLPGQTAWDRPDLVCRVFKMKMDEFLNDLYKKNVFGKVKAAVYVIEFQKRGLPHLHSLVILEDEYKLKTAAQVDRCICAEIPDKKLYPVLHSRVMSHMIHLPCNSTFRKCKEGRDGKCSKRFPKAFQDQTVLNEDSYPLYQRKDQPSVDYFHGRAKLGVNNRYVVPYNPYLLLKFNGHINVEVCNTVAAVKYLYKYIYKGYDRLIVEMKGLDEIARYENCRYVSSTEAFWRMKNSLNMHGRFPYVHRLPIHVEDGEEVTFEQDADLAYITEKLKTDTQLTGWFKLNQKHPEFNGLTYFEIPKYCTWNGKKKQWIKRAKNKLNKNQDRTRSVLESENKIYEDIVVRTHNILPQDTDRFYLKAILAHKPGAKSWTDLRTVDGIVCETYEETASRLGLLDNDQIWIDTLTEATAKNCSSSKLVRLFSYMLMHSPMIEPSKLWKRFKAALTHNLIQSLSKEECEEEALFRISKYLNEYDKKLSDFKLPNPNRLLIDVADRTNRRLQDEQTNNLNRKKLTEEQSEIYSEIEEKLKKRKINNLAENENLIFIDAPGGTGKTFLLNRIINGMKREGFKVVAVAHTGIAAMLLQDGRTAHSTFKLPLNIEDGQKPFCEIKRGTKLAEYLQTIDLIIWDEISMTSNRTLDCLDRTLKDLCRSESAFANKIMLFAGDFRQILPIIQFGTREDVTAQIVKNSNYWPFIKKFKLTKNLRLSEDQEDFGRYLLDIGEDRVAKNQDDEIELDERLIHQGDLNSFIDFFYGETLKEADIERYQNTTILAPLNEDVHKINGMVLSKLQSKNETKVYLSRDTICKEQENWCIPTEILNNINQSGLPLHRLELKTGATAFIMRNIDLSAGLCNGTRIVVTELGENLITAKVIDGNLKNSTIEIPRFQLYSDEKQGIVFKRRQFPIRLAFSTSMHKVQGQTLDRVGIYQKHEIFCHGQLYVALSRVKRFENIRIFFDDQTRRTIRNIVYHEVFDSDCRQNIVYPEDEQIRQQSQCLESALDKMDIDCESFSDEVFGVQSHVPVTDPVIIEKYGITIRKSDLECLKPREWLNDNIINFYFEMLSKKYQPNVYCFNTFFFTSLQRHGNDVRNSWTRSVNLMNYQIILMPIHLQSHWTLIAIQTETHRIEYYNSLLSPNDAALRLVKDYLEKETNEVNWTMENMSNLPIQTNGTDCGVFICQFGLHLCKRDGFQFDQGLMNLIRRRMVNEITNDTLSD